MASSEQSLERTLLRHLRSAAPSQRSLLRLLAGSRADAGLRDLADRVLVGECLRLQACCEEIRNSHEELRRLVEQATAPPWFPALFLGLVETVRGRLARVRCESAARLVCIADDVDTGSLRRGDEVCLNEQQNLLVHRLPGGDTESGSIATLQRRLEDGRLCIRDVDGEYVVAAAQALADEPPERGDRVRWQRAAMLAVERLPREDGATPFVVADVGQTPPQRLGGMSAERDRVIDCYVKHIAHPQVADRYAVADGNRRLLLEGPPGCGKTLLARVLACAIKRETGRPVRLIVVSGSALYDPYVGQTERNIRSLFRAPPGFDGILMIFLDEIDAIARARGGAGNVHGDRFLGTLLGEMEGFRDVRNVVVVAATNRAEILDPALLERFAYRLRVDRPGRRAARDIFRIHLPSTLPLRPNGEAREDTLETMVETAVALLYDENAANEVARLQFRDGSSRTVHARELLSGRLIEQIALAARQRGFERHVAGAEPGLVVEDVQRAVGDAIARLGATLTVRNVHAHLPDVAAELDVVRVDPLPRRVQPERYRLRH